MKVFCSAAGIGELAADLNAASLSLLSRRRTGSGGRGLRFEISVLEQLANATPRSIVIAKKSLQFLITIGATAFRGF
jgi:hypothetical protein